MSSGSGFNRPSPVDDGEPEYDKIIISALTLLVVVLLVFCLHVYARWIWVQSVRFSWRSRRRAASRRRQFYFSGEEPARLKNVGLDSATLESLPMFVYRSKSFTDGLDCAVCLCDFKEDEKARLLPNCKHSFHVECIDMWFISHSTCPLCRTGAQPEEPVLKSAGIDQISATIREPIASEIHENLNSEQGQTASSEEEYNVPNPTNLLSRCRPEQTNAEIDEGSSGGRALMAYVAIEIPMRPDGLWSPGEAHQHCSPNGSQSASKSPVTHLRSLTNMFNRDTERKVFPSDHTGEFDVENHGPEQGQ